MSDPRTTPLLNSRASLALAWIGLGLGTIFVWWHPSLYRLVDASLAPLVASILYIVVERWTNARGAKVAVCCYLLFLTISLTLLKSPGLAARNLTFAGSAQLLVGLGALALLEHLALSPMVWSIVLVLASDFHPQFTFVPLLMMTLLTARQLLVVGFVDKARAAALRSSFLCVLVLLASRVLGSGPLPRDGITLPLAWWIASWLLDGEALMPRVARVMLAIILSAVTVADFHPWPGLAIVFLLAYAVSWKDRHSPSEATVRGPAYADAVFAAQQSATSELTTT